MWKRRVCLSTVCPGVAVSGSLPGTALSGPGSQLIAHCCLDRHRIRWGSERDIPLGCSRDEWVGWPWGVEGGGGRRESRWTPPPCGVYSVLTYSISISEWMTQGMIYKPLTSNNYAIGILNYKGKYNYMAKNTHCLSFSLDFTVHSPPHTKPTFTPPHLFQNLWEVFSQ